MTPEQEYRRKHIMYQIDRSEYVPPFIPIAVCLFIGWITAVVGITLISG